MTDRIDIKKEWNLADLLKEQGGSEEAEKKIAFSKACETFVNRWKKRSDYLEKPSVLKTALNEYEKLAEKFSGGGDVAFYYALKSSLDQNDPELKASCNKISDLVTKWGNELEFFTHRISKVSEKKQKQFLEAPELIDYRHHLELMFLEAKYLLSEDEEKILNLTSQTSYSNWVEMTSDFLSRNEAKIFNDKGKIVTKSFGEISESRSDKNKKVRDSATEEFNRILKENIDVAEVELNSVLQYKKVSDELRHMERPDLSRHISDDIDTRAVDSLLEAVESRFDISKNYYKLKAQLMGVKKLKYNERSVEYGSIGKKYSFEDSVSLVANTLRRLDGEFYYIFKDMVENGNIDAFPKKGKVSGGFCASALKNKPTYILMNHVGKLNDVVTLAHEMGHAINDELIKKHQSALNLDTPVSTAEVASTFMQDFVLEEIAGEVTDLERLSLSMTRLDDAVSSVIRQVACYKFEQELHNTYREKGYLSKTEIGKLFQKNMKAYMGEYVEQSEGSENWWVPWEHIRNFFYNYSYASGHLISSYLQGETRKNPRFISKVKDFLSAGSSVSPKEIFARLGVDIDDKKFWLEGLEEINNLLKDTEKLARKLGKI